MTLENNTPDTGTDSDLVEHIGADLWLAFRAYERAMYLQVAERGFEDISLPDSDVLVFIGPNGAQLVEIARQRRVSKQAVHEQVHSLVKRGYLTLETDPKDRRARIVRHSQKGRALVEALKGIKSSLHIEVADALGDKRLAELKDMLDLIRNQLQKQQH